MLRTPLLAATLSALGALAAAAPSQAIPLVGKPMPDEVEILAVTLAADAPSTAPLKATKNGVRFEGDAGWIEFELRVDTNGRYRCELETTEGPENGTAWVEDYVENPDGRSYDVTGPMTLPAGGGRVARDGSPLDVGVHRMRLHLGGGATTVKSLRFARMVRHQMTPTTLVQRTQGDEWVLVWSDEFDGRGVPNPTRWTYDVGDWGWGNREPQYYTVGRPENARQENGILIIEARPDDLGHEWTSARLTTRGKVSFLYGRIEIRAMVPSADGTWAAGWLLGDAYRDEKSWPYCGEVDVLEAVGCEIDDATGAGRNHASCHTRAYYFKQGNHISSTLPMDTMARAFHVYAMEWDEHSVRMSVDGQQYYVYDRKEPEGAWPFDQPQNLILNLAMGGGMGGPIQEGLGAQRFLIDYVRVYGRR